MDDEQIIKLYLDRNEAAIEQTDKNTAPIAAVLPILFYTMHRIGMRF